MKEAPKKAWMDIESAPKDGTVITVYDPKPGVEYGPDIHTAYFDAEKNRFVATTGVDTDPYDIDPEMWLCTDASPSALREALSAYLSTLDQRPQYQDEIQMSDAEIAEREIGAFIAWLENPEQ